MQMPRALSPDSKSLGIQPGPTIMSLPSMACKVLHHPVLMCPCSHVFLLPVLITLQLCWPYWYQICQTYPSLRAFAPAASSAGLLLLQMFSGLVSSHPSDFCCLKTQITHTSLYTPYFSNRFHFPLSVLPPPDMTHIYFCPCLSASLMKAVTTFVQLVAASLVPRTVPGVSQELEEYLLPPK